jgi:predicted nucleotidyltransferase/DNA-binding transcriptional ArsR family regulator
MDLSVQAVYAHLSALEEDRYVTQTGRRDGTTRPEKLYTVNESAYVFAAFDGTLSERQFELAQTHKTVLSVLSVPQPEFHAPLLSYLFSSSPNWPQPRLIVVYGSVARGTAEEGSDIDLLHVVPGSRDLWSRERYDALGEDVVIETGLESGPKRILSREWFTEDEFEQGLDAGSPFLRNVLDEAIALFDPDDLLGEYRRTYRRE